MRTISNRAVLVLAITGVAGLLLLIASQKFGMPELIGPGLLLFAIGVFTAGLEAITRRYISERSQERVEIVRFHGSTAILLGLTLILFAGAIAVAGVAFLTGSEQALYTFLLARPGFALVPAGAMLGATGSARVLGAQNWRGSTWRFISNLPERFGGIFLLLIGLALLAAGVFDFLAPEAFDQRLHALLAPFRTE